VRREAEGMERATYGFDEEQRNSAHAILASTNGDGKVIGLHSGSDEFFLPVDNVEISLKV
jgi:hypothetical protein